MNFIINRSKGEHNGTPLHKTMFYRILINLSSWGTIEIWPQEQVQVKALLKGLRGSSAGLNPGLSHDRQGLNP